MDESLKLASYWIRDAQEIVVFTGAGISAESGIPTFRDDAGFWRRFPPEHFANWKGLLSTATRRPRLFAQFVHAVLGPIAAAEPNAAHRALAEAERRLPITIVTQNIDGLHQAAGSTIVHEVHGSLLEIVYRSGGFRTLLSRAQLRRIAGALERAANGVGALPRSLMAMRGLVGVGRRGAFHPRVVMFGDAMAEPDWTAALRIVQGCDCLLQIRRLRRRHAGRQFAGRSACGGRPCDRHRSLRYASGHLAPGPRRSASARPVQCSARRALKAALLTSIRPAH